MLHVLHYTIYLLFRLVFRAQIIADSFAFFFFNFNLPNLSILSSAASGIPIPPGHVLCHTNPHCA